MSDANEDPSEETKWRELLKMVNEMQPTDLGVDTYKVWSDPWCLHAEGLPSSPPSGLRCVPVPVPRCPNCGESAASASYKVNARIPTEEERKVRDLVHVAHEMLTCKCGHEFSWFEAINVNKGEDNG